MNEEEVLRLCDIIRQIGYNAHAYLKSGYLKHIYVASMYNRLRKAGLMVEPKAAIRVFDEDDTLLGDYVVDLLVAKEILVQIICKEHILDKDKAIMLGYIKAAKMRHGLVINFGAPRYEISKLVQS